MNNSSKNILKIRKKIDKIDNKIIKLTSKRMKLAQPVADYKFRNGLNLTNKSREKEIIKSRIDAYKKIGFNSPKFIDSLFKLMFNESKRIQQNHIKMLKQRREI
jgi:chorismate mutase/prephenate dehydratase